MKKKLFIACFAIFFANSVSSQIIHHYEGNIKLPEDLHEFGGFIDGFNPIGKGSYEYYENEDETRVKHGKFLVSFEKYSFKREITGSYKDGKKNGVWVIRDIITEKTNYAKHCEMSITFEDDIFHGPCKYVKNVANNKFIIICSFEKGRLAGDLTIEHVDKWKKGITNYINGTIGTSGLPEGIWNIKQKGGIEITQKRLYLYGGLIAAEEQDFSTGDKYMVFCAFPNQKKLPITKEITIIAGDKGCISYQNQIACKQGFELTDHCFYPDRSDIERLLEKSKLPTFGNMWITELIDLFPSSMWTDEQSALGTQRDSWAFFYYPASE